MRRRFTCGSVLAPLLATGLLATGCASRATYFRVTHPATLDATAFGNSFAVASFEGGYPQAASQIRRELEQRIAHSLNRSIRLMGQGAGLTITGTVVSNDYQERIDAHSGQCSRRVEAGRDAAGRMQYRTVQYGCTWLTRAGTAVARLQLGVMATQTGQVIVSQMYEQRRDATTSGMRSPYSDENREPPPIDGSSILRTLNSQIVDQFARIILPWQQVVEVELEDCDDDARCERGFHLVRSGDLRGAEGLFTQVIDETAPAAAAPDPDGDTVERLAEALYNRGVARGYQGRYAEAVADLVRAIQMRPNESAWGQQLAAVRTLQHNQEALRRQGAISADTQDVRTGGAP
ncbi:MAG: tetratricopeptide repeat protein [Deltaproteobacteria bacterium]|nr:tetratricopeptide repeat protein [Deltaproteobacteria bacterium]